MNHTSKGIINVACCGKFKRKSAEEAKWLIEDLTKCNCRAPSKTSGRSSRLKGSGVIELKRMTAIEAKLDPLMNKMGNHYRRMLLAHEVGTIDGNEQKSSANEGLVHGGPYQVEEAHFLNANCDSPTPGPTHTGSHPHWVPPTCGLHSQEYKG